MDDFQRFSRWEADDSGEAPKRFIAKSTWYRHRKTMLEGNAAVLFPNIAENGQGNLGLAYLY